LPSFMKTVAAFAQGPYAAAVGKPAKAPPSTLQSLSDYTGIPPATLESWRLDVGTSDNAGTLLFLLTLMKAEGQAVGGYDGRVAAVDTGIAGSISPNSGGNDPTMTAVNGVYTVMWNVYLNDELKFTSTSSFTDSNDQAFTFWDFGHIDPTGAQKGKDAKGDVILYTAGDLAATMALNPNLRVLAANGYYDSVTPFLQTDIDLANMPLKDPSIRQNLAVKYYPSGHMIYLDGASRTALKADVAALYDTAVADHVLLARVRARQPKCDPYFKRAAGKAAARAAGPARPWSVPDLCKAYNWPTGLAGGGRIAIVELDGGWVRSDMDGFFSSIGQPTPNIADITVDGARNNPNQHLGTPDQDPDVEVTLDIQVAAAAYYVATGKPATIRVYWAKNELGSIAAAVRAAAADGCDTCSISWGKDEALWKEVSQQLGKDLIQEMELAAKAATDAGMAVFAASGDNDAGDGGANPVNVDVPSSCPHIIGCGGTTKTRTTETVWNDNPGQSNGEGTGGGYSNYFPQQSFQAGAPNGPGRMVPDVAANADDMTTPYEIVVHGKSDKVGGTSAVAPLYAGLFAAFGTKLGFVSPQLWANHLCFNDITEGDNGFYRARIGPDPCTGIGSPIGTKLAALFGAAAAVAAPAAAAGVVASPPIVPAGWSGTIFYEFAEGTMIKTAKVPAGRTRAKR
jgi:hypothetical protein